MDFSAISKVAHKTLLPVGKIGKCSQWWQTEKVCVCVCVSSSASVTHTNTQTHFCPFIFVPPPHVSADPLGLWPLTRVVLIMVSPRPSVCVCVEGEYSLESPHLSLLGHKWGNWATQWSQTRAWGFFFFLFFSSSVLIVSHQRWSTTEDIWTVVLDNALIYSKTIIIKK